MGALGAGDELVLLDSSFSRMSLFVLFMIILNLHMIIWSPLIHGMYMNVYEYKTVHVM